MRLDAGNIVVLKNCHGKYMSARQDGGFGQVEHQRDWEKLTMVDGGDNTVGFLTAHKTFLSARNDGTVSQQSILNAWEQFTVHKLSKGKYSFETHHKAYLSAGKDGSHKQHPSIGDCETFEVVLIHKETNKKNKLSKLDGKVVGLRSMHGSYLSANKDGVISHQVILTNSEKFTVEKLNQGKFAFKSDNGTYLCANTGWNVDEFCLQPHCKGWEAFEFIDLAKGMFAIKTAHGKFVSAVKDTAQLVQKPQVKEWESWRIEILQ
jgi:hypothetical protein